ncbi:neurogenic locus protein delta-like [Daphnia carinata]|uniref:neurogenic locus protein delta-like n=1 Tax=Daphnia carinata TaxID=120202 RepID=UPI00257DA763|nr:neurogenic locus protein delta-like [Daphnia carinata]
MAASSLISLVCLVFSIFTLTTMEVRSSGVFELRFDRFQNELGRDAKGHCCDGFKASSSSPNGGARCSEACRTQFRVCLKHYQTSIDLSGACTYGDFSTPVLGDNSLDFTNATNSNSSVTNGYTVRLPFEFSWPGTFSLIIEAYHQPSNTTDKVLVMQMATQRWMDSSNAWKADSYSAADGLHALNYSYRVKCDEHYYGDGCANLCRPRDDKFGHYTCSEPSGDKVCLPGWSGEYCTKAICLPGCHDEHGFCNDPNECLCKLGWQGKLCDQCIRYPGCLHGSCQQPWQCYCNEGWGGLFCNQDLNYCTNHKPCKNGGTCFNTGQGSYTCTCPAEYTGTDCELVKDDCTVIPCLNGGTCSGETNATCNCPAGFHGRRCETSTQQTCSDNPCLHGATCVDTTDKGYMCLCPDGFDGANCGHQVDDCAVNRCQNGGSCVDKVNGFKCICPAGFTGPLCQTDIDDCQTDNPCLNGGSCADLVNSFRCLCVPGFTGSLCQTNVDDCLTKPCSNGGQCHDLVNDYRCTCKPGFAGKDCSQEVNECSTRPCLNGGTCMDRINEFKCVCPRGYSGLRCERNAAHKNNSTAPTVLGSASRLSNVPSEASLSVAQIVMIATISTAVPLIAIVSCVVIVCLKKRRQKEQLRSDEEARRQNEQNVVHSISKKMDKMDKCLEEHRIINTLDFPSSKGKSINEPEYAIVQTKDVSPHHHQQQQQQQYNIHRTSKALNVETFNSDKLLNSSCQSKEVVSNCEPTYVTLDKRLSVTPSVTCSSSPSEHKRPFPLQHEDVLATSV